MTRRTALLGLLWLASGAAQSTLPNPLLASGPDPWSIYRNGWYYYTNTTGRNLTLWRTHDLSDLANAEKKVVWAPAPGTPYSKDIWAPELHFLQGKWYFYFAADDGQNRNHRLYVLENASPDPFADTWVFKGQLETPEGKWAIDASVFEHRGVHYLLWSGWEGDTNVRQNIYICRLKNPWTTEGPRVRISKPELAWETVGDPDVNEGPEALIHGDRVFVVYSASGCWTDSYVLGMLSAKSDANLLDPDSWTKHARPVFRARNEAGTFAAGHNSFFKSPDGKEDWILYHANPEPGAGCGGKRSPRAQRFTWRADGTPDFGTPVPVGRP